MSSRGKQLLSLARKKASIKKTNKITRSDLHVEEGYLSKCKRFLNSLPNRRDGKSVARRLSYQRRSPSESRKVDQNNVDETNSDTNDNHNMISDHGSFDDDAHESEQVSAPPQNNLCLLWKTGEESPDESEKEYESPSPEQVSDEELVETQVERNIENDNNRISVHSAKKKKFPSARADGSKSVRAVLQSMKRGFTTIKQNLSQLQSKNGLQSDYLLIMKYNGQKANLKNSSVFAEKYLAIGAGDLKTRFSSGDGVVYNPDEFLILRNESKHLEIDSSETTKAIKNFGHNSRRPKPTFNKGTELPSTSDDVQSECVSVDRSSESSSEVNIFDMKSKARKVSTPGQRIADKGTLVYGNGVNLVTPELKSQRAETNKARKIAAKKVSTDIIETFSKNTTKTITKKPKKKSKLVRF